MFDSPPSSSSSNAFRESMFLSLLMGIGICIVFTILASLVVQFLGAAILGDGWSSLASSGAFENATEAEILFAKCSQGIASLISFGLAAIVWSKMENRNPFETLSINRKPEILSLVLAAIMIPLAIPFVEFINMDSESFSFPSGFAELEHLMKQIEEKTTVILMAFLSDTSYTGLLLNTVVLAMVPAISEEVFFRGFMLNTLRRKLNPHVAVWLCAFLFSLFHFQVYGFFSRMLLGAMLGYFLVYTGSLWVPIAGHFVNNFLNVLLSWFAFRGYLGDIEIEAKMDLPLWMSLSSVVLTGALMFYFIKKFKPDPEIKDD